jgi:hypothetical protein
LIRNRGIAQESALSLRAITASTAARLAAISAAECCKYSIWAWFIISICRLETPLAPEIILTRGRYRAEWHHHPANAVEYGLTMFRILRSIWFMPASRLGKDPIRAGYAKKAAAALRGADTRRLRRHPDGRRPGLDRRAAHPAG